MIPYLKTYITHQEEKCEMFKVNEKLNVPLSAFFVYLFNLPENENCGNQTHFNSWILIVNSSHTALQKSTLQSLNPSKHLKCPGHVQSFDFNEYLRLPFLSGGCEGEQGHGLLVHLEWDVLPEPPAGPSRCGHRHADAGVQLAAEGGREAAEGEGEWVPAPQDRSGLQLAGQHAPLLLQHQHRGEARPGGPLLQGAAVLLRHGHPQVRTPETDHCVNTTRKGNRL